MYRHCLASLAASALPATAGEAHAAVACYRAFHTRELDLSRHHGPDLLDACDRLRPALGRSEPVADPAVPRVSAAIELTAAS